VHIALPIRGQRRSARILGSHRHRPAWVGPERRGGPGFRGRDQAVRKSNAAYRPTEHLLDIGVVCPGLRLSGFEKVATHGVAVGYL